MFFFFYMAAPSHFILKLLICHTALLYISLAIQTLQNPLRIYFEDFMCGHLYYFDNKYSFVRKFLYLIHLIKKIISG